MNNNIKTTDNTKKKRKLSMPTPITILLVLLAVIVMVTWVIPSGYYAPDGKFHTSSEPVGLFDVFSAAAYGFLDSASLLFLLFGMGAFINMTLKTEAMEASLGSFMKKMDGKEILVIPIFMTIFALAGTLFGIAEETLAFFPIIVPIFIVAGYDALTGVFIILLGAGTGSLASTINPFSVGSAIDAIPTTGIGDNAVPITGATIAEGMLFRWISFFVLLSIAISFVVWYALRVKKNKAKSGVSHLHDEHLEEAKKIYHMDAIPKFTTTRKIIMTIAMFALLFMVIALIPWNDLGVSMFEDLHVSIQENVPWLLSSSGFGWSALGSWNFIELGVFFFIVAVIIGLIAGKKEKEIISIASSGASSMMGVGLVISVARGVAVVIGGKELVVALDQSDGTIAIAGEAEISKIINDIQQGYIESGSGEGWVIKEEGTEFYVWADNNHSTLNVSLANTILDLTSDALSEMEGNHYRYNISLYFLYIPLAFLIPSTTGLATATMNIIGPLGENMVGSAASSITMYSFAVGLVNYVTPTSAVLMGGLALAKVPYGNYLKSVGRFVGIILVASIILILIGSAGGGALINF